MERNAERHRALLSIKTPISRIPLLQLSSAKAKEEASA